MTKDSVTSVWKEIEILRSSNRLSPPTLLEEETVSVDSKRLYIGNGSQWTIKARNLTAGRLEGDENRPSSIVLTMSTDEITVKMTRLMEDTHWFLFRKRLVSFMKHAKIQLQLPETTKTTTTLSNKQGNQKVVPLRTRIPLGDTSDFLKSTGKMRFSPSRPARPLQQQQHHDFQSTMSPKRQTIRGGRTFGKKVARLVTTSRIPWDDEDTGSYNNLPAHPSPVPLTNQSRSVPKSDEGHDNDRVRVHTDEEDDQVSTKREKDDDDDDDDDHLFDSKPLGGNKRKVLDDSDDDDKDDDDDDNSPVMKPVPTGPTATATTTRTPLGPRPHVSPASRTQAKVNPQTPKRGSNQPRITSFVSARNVPNAMSFDPSRRVGMTPDQRSTALKTNSWLKSTSAGRTSPTKARKDMLFGTRLNRPATPKLEEDPIDEFASPPSSPRRRGRALEALDRADQAAERTKLDLLLDKTTGSRHKRHRGLPLEEPAVPRRLSLDPSSKSPDASAPPKYPWKGLRNLGNTCYLNSSIQMLVTLAGTTLRDSNWWDGLRGKGGPLTQSLLTVVDQLVHPPTPSSSAPVSPSQVKQAIDAITDRFLGFEQRDAHEFLSYLIDSMQEELDQPIVDSSCTNEKVESEDLHKESNSHDEDSKEDGPLIAHDQDGDVAATGITDPGAFVPAAAWEKSTDKLGKHAVEPSSIHGTNDMEKQQAPTDDFRLTVEVCLKCESCGYTRKRQELYRHLSLDIVSTSNDKLASIPDSLGQFFQPETREIRCEKCAEGKFASQSQRIVTHPKYLLLHLKRFIFVEKPVPTGDENAPPNSPSTRPQVEYIFMKSKAPVDLTAKLSLEAFCADPKQKAYRLRSLCHHLGSRPSSGHYTADVLRPYRNIPTSDPSVDESTISSNANAPGRHMETDSPPEEEWITFDDGRSCKTSLETIQSSKSKQTTAYMLLYSLED